MYNQGHPMFEALPNGQKAIRTMDGSLVPLIPVNVQMEVSATTAVIPANGAPVVMPVVDALAIQTTLAVHWLAKWQAAQNELADLRAKLNESQGEGRVYELDADIRITPEEFAEMKSTLTALSEYFDIDDEAGIKRLYGEVTAIEIDGSKTPVRPLPSEMEVALRAVGVSTIGGFRAFCEHYKVPVPEVARG